MTKKEQWTEPPDLKDILSDNDLLTLVDRLKSDDVVLDGGMSAATCSILRAIFTDSRMTSGLGKAQRTQLFRKILPVKVSTVFCRLVMSRFGSKLVEKFFLDKKQNVDGEYFDKMIKSFTKDPEKFAFDKNASYALQQAIVDGSDDQVSRLVQKLPESDIVQLCTNSYATRVMQVIVKNDSLVFKQFRVDIADKLKHHFAEVATDKRGMFVTNGLFETLGRPTIRVTMKHVFSDTNQMKKLNSCSLGRSFIIKLRKDMKY